ncbi:unnamed protein product [Trifolium pratense]|uniref:Uncharacterized protein n=1 Tax=Trifolium pratense TaxID=57577 RepID=A0ACB0MD49_TRIPR|nr:unnamed protein product [Trifolium pratense]
MILNKDKYRRDSNEESKILEKMKKRKQCDNQNQENYENVGSEDRLSDLPDYVILHILSFLNTKHVVRTCVLSKRWKHLWKRIPTLILHASRFSTVKQFSVFVSKILTLRDSSSSLNVLDLDPHGDIEPLLLKKILNYVCSHSSHLEELGISVNGDSSLIMSCVSSCRALTSLMLSVYPRGGIFGSNYETLFPKSLNLPALTSLDLTNFVFCGSVLNISSETLVNLALHYNSSEFPKIELSAPSLCTFTFTGTPRQKICGSGLSSVKQVNISADIISRCDAAPMILLSWLLDLANVKSLTVTSTALWMLSLVPDLLEVKLPSLCILKSMEIKLEPLCVQGALLYMVKDAMLKKAAANSRKEVARLRREFKAGSQPSSIPDGMVNFLLQNSSSAKVDITTVY